MIKFEYNVLKNFSYQQLFLLRNKMETAIKINDKIRMLNPTEPKLKKDKAKYILNYQNINKAISHVEEKTNSIKLSKNIGLIKYNLN